MNGKNEIVREFSKYCSKCDGQCCKRGVFSVFGWELEKLSANFENFQEGHVSDTRGTCIDIAINKLCLFSTGHGCKLPVELRPTDCLTYPFYPNIKENTGEVNIDEFVIDKECFFSEEIARDEKLIKAVDKYWKGMIKKVDRKEINDWVGKDGNWQEWYKNTADVKRKKNNC